MLESYVISKGFYLEIRGGFDFQIAAVRLLKSTRQDYQLIFIERRRHDYATDSRTTCYLDALTDIIVVLPYRKEQMFDNNGGLHDPSPLLDAWH